MKTIEPEQNTKETQQEVIGERVDVLVYRAKDGVPYYGVEITGRRGSDWTGETLPEMNNMDK
jgi:hypothetical protein